MLESIGEDVIDNLVKIALINPYKFFIVRGVNAITDMLALRQREERLHNILDEIDEIRLTEVHLHLSGVNLANIHELIHQTVDTQTVAIHQIESILLCGILFSLAQSTQRTHHKGKRSTYFMSKVGKQPKAQFFHLSILFPLFAAPALPEDSQQHHNKTSQQDKSKKNYREYFFHFCFIWHKNIIFSTLNKQMLQN